MFTAGKRGKFLSSVVHHGFRLSGTDGQPWIPIFILYSN